MSRDPPRGDAPGGALATALAEHEGRLSHCVHCGFCLPACPTYVRLGDEADSPRGRLHLMAAVVEGRLHPGSDAFQTHLDRCLGCRACETVCPSGVEYGFLLERAREVAGAARKPGAGTRALLALVRRPVPFRIWMWMSRALRRSGLAAASARILPRSGPLGRIRFGLGMLLASAPAPLRGLPGFEAGKGPADGPASPHAAERSGESVGVLAGCVQEGLFGRVNRATWRVLEANGHDVREVPGQACCGALHAHAGALETARELARRNIAAFETAGVDRIAANAAGCGAAMKEYGELLEGDPEWSERARAFSSRVRDVSEILAGEGRRPVTGAPVRAKVVYDPPCHLLHGQRVADPPLRLLESVPGLEVVVARNGEECCGGAGIYGITHPELGARIGGDKGAAVREAGADLVATGNPGCAMQIGAVLRLERPGPGSIRGICHPVELLAESYRRAGLGRGEES